MKRNDINFLKTIAIIAVILFHMDLLKNGYLGVDIFLVVAGFLTTKSLAKKNDEEKFSYKDFFCGKLVRLMPVVLMGTLVTFLIALFVGMLPDDFENLSESIIASNLFSNNILSALTTKNYWDIVNSYKPLYHLWYLGILVEFYLIFPFIMRLIKKKSKKGNYELNIKIVLSIIAGISLVLYFIPSIPEYYKFYYLPFRLFEFLIGGLCYSFSKKFKLNDNLKSIVGICSRIILILMLTVFPTILDGGLNLILTVFLTGFIILLDNKFNIGSKVWNFISEKTYSFYIWHQIIFAFYRCYVSDIDNVFSIILTLILTIIVSLISYYILERVITKRYNKKPLYILSLILTDIFIIVLSFLVYLNAGVVRNVPELDIEKTNVSRGMHAEYCDRIYNYNKNFEINDKYNVLIIGNSFARDFANIILESNYSEKFNIQYHFDYSTLNEDEVKKSDYVLIYGDKSEVPEIILKNVDTSKIFGIGTKNFGKTNERFYFRRNLDNYFKQTVLPTKDILDLNTQYAKKWGNNYINILELLQNSDGTVNVFTNDNKFISQDCRHLTKNGAIYLSKLIDFNLIFDLDK